MIPRSSSMPMRRPVAAAPRRDPTLKHRIEVLLLALAIDLLVGEPPTRLHPVVAIGTWLTWGERIAPHRPNARLLWGAFWPVGGIGICWAIGQSIPRQHLFEALLAKPLLAFRALDRAGGAVHRALVVHDLPRARQLLGWHLVSRPTADLDSPLVAAATIESLAENLSDSVIAPAVWYLAGGWPLLATYRLANTADAMWGYHTPRHEQLGKAAARLDDLLNFLPARLCAALFAVAAQTTAGTGARTLMVACRDHGHTASPNAGWPMAAMAGALNTTLIKQNHYRLGDGPRVPDADLIDQARRLCRRVVELAVGALAATAYLAGDPR
ncbi:MAG: adenosylcobinamide-phosphate synthase CbiB [Herpetosiphon sp.]